MVLHYRNPTGLRRTLEAVASQSLSPAVVLVVDNSAGDGSIDRGVRSGVRVLAQPHNLGYAAGMNAGMAALEDEALDAVLLLTHECVLHEGALAALWGRLAGESGVGAVGPLLAWASRPGDVWSAGGALDPRSGRLSHLAEPSTVSGWQGAPPRAVDWLDGACLLVRSEAARAAGPLDERYFLYFEEADYLLRLGDLGWRVECIPAAVAEQEPAGMPVYLVHRNRLLLTRARHRGGVVAELARTGRNLLGYARRRESRPAIAPALRGVLDGLRSRGGPPTDLGLLRVQLNPRREGLRVITDPPKRR